MFLRPAVKVGAMYVVRAEAVAAMGAGVAQVRFGSRGPGSYIPSKR